MSTHAFPFPDWVVYQFGNRHTPPPEVVTSVHQIHSRIVMRDTGATGRIGEGDALVSNRPGSLLGIRTADCVPILMVDPVRRAVAAIHAGWRGTVDGVASATVEALSEAFGSNPTDLIAAIGPAIGNCCFEVGPEVAVQFRPIFPERNDLDRKVTIDLAEANRRILVRAGLPGRNILPEGSPECTRCHSERYHSWRRDRDSAGRMWAVIGIRPD